MLVLITSILLQGAKTSWKQLQIRTRSPALNAAEVALLQRAYKFAKVYWRKASLIEPQQPPVIRSTDQEKRLAALAARLWTRITGESAGHGDVRAVSNPYLLMLRQCPSLQALLQRKFINWQEDEPDHYSCKFSVEFQVGDETRYLLTCPYDQAVITLTQKGKEVPDVANFLTHVLGGKLQGGDDSQTMYQGRTRPKCRVWASVKTDQAGAVWALLTEDFRNAASTVAP